MLFVNYAILPICLIMTSKHLFIFSTSEQLCSLMHSIFIKSSSNMAYQYITFVRKSCALLQLVFSSPDSSWSIGYLFFSLMVINLNKVQSLFRIIQCDVIARCQPVFISWYVTNMEETWISDLDYFIKLRLSLWCIGLPGIWNGIEMWRLFFICTSVPNVA